MFTNTFNKLYCERLYNIISGTLVMTHGQWSVSKKEIEDISYSF